MLIQVAEIRKVIGRILEVPVYLTPMVLDSLRVLSPIEGEIVVENQGDRLLVAGNIETSVELECVRCLVSFPYNVQVSFRETFVEGEISSASEEVALNEEGLDTFYFQGDSLDLSDLIRDHILLSLPWLPLCKQDCCGLCQSCGANLNFETCKCSGPGTEKIT